MIQYGAMQYHNWDLLEEEPLNPLLGRKTIHGQSLTIARIRLSKGAVVPMGEERILRAGVGRASTPARGLQAPLPNSIVNS
jgi:hypothetical protein